MAKKIEDRIESLESEILKYKRTTIVALIFSIICGGGGLVGLATWISSMPKEATETTKLQVETDKIELEIIKDSLEISMKKFQNFKSKHNSEIESISRQLELFKTLGSDEKVKTLTALLIEKEQQFQLLITTTSDMCRALASRSPGGSQWIQRYVNTMNDLNNQSRLTQENLEKIK